ncbi:MAG: hypothetical protein RL117_1275 [Verrucomicrobiota bacterium]|jgi:hypothetical protein
MAEAGRNFSPCQVAMICYNSIYINKCIFPKKQNTRYEP